MTVQHVDHHAVKADPSPTWRPDADRWNPWQTLVEKYPYLTLVTEHRLPDRYWGLSSKSRNKIWLCSGLGPLQRESTLAHELTHFELDSFIAPGQPGHLEAERVVLEVCARRLIPIRALANLMLTYPNERMGRLAWLLRVDVPTLEARLITLSPVERQTLSEVRGGPLPKVPHYEPYDGLCYATDDLGGVSR